MLTSIIFDVGETLIDTTSWNKKLEGALFEYVSWKYNIDKQHFESCYNAAMSEVDKVKNEDPHVDKIAFGAERLAILLELDSGSGRDLEVFIKDFRLANLSLFDNARPILEDLHKRYDLYVLSNARTESIAIFLDKFAIKGLFKEIFTSQSFGMRKDDGGLFRVFLDKTSLNPKNCLMVGDDASIDGRSMDFGIPFCFIDRKRREVKHDYTFKIENLCELNVVLKFFSRDIKRKCHLCKADIENRVVCEKCENEFRQKVKKDPVLLAMLNDLMNFTGMTEEKTIDKLVVGPIMVRDDWINFWPVTEREIHDFYSCNANYLYDLTVANMQDEWMKQNEMVVGYAKTNGYDDILDFGCGIAQPLVELAENGKRVYGVDLSAQNIAYVKSRFASRKMTVTLSEEVGDREYDFVICTDVLEHIMDPVSVFRLLLSHIRQEGAIAFTVRFFREDDYLHPMHLAVNRDRREEINHALRESCFVKETDVGAPRGLEIWKKGVV